MVFEAQEPADPWRKYRKLNLGCGFDKREGYINVDLQGFHGPDIEANVLELRGATSNYYEEILARDVIEHFKWSETMKALLEWNRILASGGRLFISTTYLPGLIARMRIPQVDNIAAHKQIIINLFSMQAYEGDYHLTAFTERLMRYYLWAAGFSIDELSVQDGWLFNVWCHKVDDYSFEHLLIDASPEHLIAMLYERILQRTPSDQELAGAVRDSVGRPRGETLLAFLLSEEREAILIQNCPNFDLTYDIQPGKQKLNAAEVRQAYLWILGREPESDAVILEKMIAFQSVGELRLALLSSEEFRSLPLAAVSRV